MSTLFRNAEIGPNLVPTFEYKEMFMDFIAHSSLAFAAQYSVFLVVILGELGHQATPPLHWSYDP